jgi:hypothetical protein
MTKIYTAPCKQIRIKEIKNKPFSPNELEMWVTSGGNETAIYIITSDGKINVNNVWLDINEFMQALDIGMGAIAGKYTVFDEEGGQV